MEEELAEEEIVRRSVGDGRYSRGNIISLVIIVYICNRFRGKTD
ncbi:hypothetical protein [Candidatus Ichthyocystis sparus]|nr:hypothetical protein [Candidatus Ichthyocystis sparus]